MQFIPRCPHCGCDDADPDGLNYGDGEYSNISCSKCGEDFVAVSQAIIMFNTATTEERASDDEWGPERKCDG